MKNNLKKFLALGVLLVFVLSIVPVAFAETGERDSNVSIQEDVEDQEEVAEQNTSEKVVDGNLERDSEKVRDRSESNKEKVKEKIKKAEERIKEARDKYQEVKERRQKAVDDLKEQNNELKELNEKSKKCKDESEVCKDSKKSLKKGVQKHLVKTNEVIAKSLEKIANRIEASKLSDEEKQTLLAELESKKTEIVALQEKASALNENSTKQDYQDAIKELKQKWQEVKKVEQKAISLLISSKMQNLVEKVSSEYSNRLQAKVDELKAKNIDTSALSTLVEKYNQEADVLKQLQTDAKSKLLSGDLAGYKELQPKIKEALNQLKKDLREFMAKYRELKESGAVSSETESEEGTETTPESSNETASETNVDNTVTEPTSNETTA